MSVTFVQDLLAESQLAAEVRWYAFRGLIGLVVGLIVVQVDGLLPGQRPGPGRSAADLDIPDLRKPPVAPDAAADLRFSVQLVVDGLKSRT